MPRGCSKWLPNFVVCHPLVSIQLMIAESQNVNHRRRGVMSVVKLFTITII